MLLNLSEEQRKKLAARLSREVDASEYAKGQLPERWAMCRALYNNEEKTSTMNVVDDMSPYPLPLWRAKADRVADAVIKTFTSLVPYVQVIVENPETQNAQNDSKYEMALMCMAEYSDFKRSLRRAFVECMNTDLGIIRVRPVYGRSDTIEGIDSERIKPENMVGYPTYVSTFEDCTTVGHKFLLSTRDVQERIDNGVYYDVKFNSTASAQEFESANVSNTLTSVDSYATSEDEYDLRPVKLYELITDERIPDENGEMQWAKVICVLAKDTEEILACQEYPYPIHWYVTMRIDDEDDTLWPNNSLAQRVQGLNMAFSDGYSAMFIGSLATAFPILAVNGSLTGTKNKKWTPAMILELPHGVTAQMLGTNFNPGALPIALQKIEEMCDSVVGISRLGTGQALPADTREAAINGILQAQSDSKEGYADAVSPAVKKYFQLLDIYLTMHFQQLKEAYGNKLIINDPSEIPESYKIEVTGQNSGSSPSALMQKLQMAMGMAQAPTSTLSPRKLEERIVQAMELPFDATGLKKDEIDMLLEIIGFLNTNGIDGAALAIGALQELIQGVANEANQIEGGGGTQVPGGPSGPSSPPAQTA